MKTSKTVAPKTFDLIVVGGGPAGMMAAGQAAKRGARVLLLEKNPNLGKKLLITGGGRCNLTNAEFDTRALLANFKDSDRFLFSAFAKHNVKDTLDFFQERGLATKVEEHKRVFPITDSAQSVWDVLKAFLDSGQVQVATKAEVKEIQHSGDLITGLVLTDGQRLKAASYILATGGKSRPETGSTGDGFRWLANLGHTIIEPDASLVPLALNDGWITQLAGVTLSNIKISVYQNNKKQRSKMGKILFTHVGVSGPTILNMSKAIGEMLPYGPVTLKLDLFPTLDLGALDNLLIKLFQTHSNKQFKNVLSPLLPNSLAAVIVSLSGISPDLGCHSLSKEARKGLGQLLKTLPLSVKGLLGVDKAIVTSGGVALTEIDFKTMRSLKIPNLYIVGDLLNIDRPSGGYSLQLCWTTGFVAGNSVPKASD